MALNPVVKSPFTDLTGAIVSHQWGSKCANFEMRAVDCFEAYGLDRALEKCDHLIADFRECSLGLKENARYDAMQAERNRQYRAGERTKENRYAPAPQADSF